MPLTVTLTAKNTSLSITNDSKVSDAVTWDEADFTWDEGTGTWNVPGFPLTKATKNNLTITNETKN